MRKVRRRAEGLVQKTKIMRRAGFRAPKSLGAGIRAPFFRKVAKYMLWALLGLFILAADQISKYYVSAQMAKGQSIAVIDRVFHITYEINTGAAFSILRGQRWLLTAAPVIAIAAFFIYLFRRRPSARLLLCSLSLIISGAAGNLIDRVRLGGVIDFLDVRLINFPIFNVADCAVVVGAGLLCAHMLFSGGGADAKD